MNKSPRKPDPCHEKNHTSAFSTGSWGPHRGSKLITSIGMPSYSSHLSRSGSPREASEIGSLSKRSGPIRHGKRYRRENPSFQNITSDTSLSLSAL